MTGRTLLLAGIALVAVALAVGLGTHAWYEQQPPDLDRSGPGTVLRLTAESGGVPPPRLRVALPDGTSATFSMAGISTSQGRPVGLVSVRSGGGQDRQLALGEGQSTTADGLRVTMLHVWRMPDGANDAVDLRVLPAP